MSSVSPHVAHGRRAAALIVLGLVALALSACTAVQHVPEVDLDAPRTQARPPARPSPVPTAGSLFHAASYRPAFEEPRARMVGDTVTVQIVENLSATQKSASTLDRSSSADGSISALPFASAGVGLRSTLAASGATAFSGKGDTLSTNTFTGSITATVVEVLPNGHLVIHGEKQIGVNANVDVLRLSGTVDPRFILPGNVVSSQQVAQARIESRSRGQQGEAQSIGWLGRFFLSVWPF